METIDTIGLVQGGINIGIYVCLIIYIAVFLRLTSERKALLYGVSYGLILQIGTLYLRLSHSPSFGYFLPTHYICAELMGLCFYYLLFLAYIDPKSFSIWKARGFMMQFFVWMLVLFAGMFLWPEECVEYPDYQSFFAHWYEFGVFWKVVLVFSCMSIYLTNVYSSLNRAFRFQKRIKNYYSNLEPHDMSWLLNLLVMDLLCAVGYMVVSFIQPIYAALVLDMLVVINWVFTANYVRMKGQYSTVEDLKEDMLVNEHVEEEAAVKGLDDEMPKLVQILEKQMKENKLYLASDLTLPELATACGTNRTSMSNCLNKTLNLSFYTFVNTYRVNKAVELMDDCKRMPAFETIYKDAGFGSYPSFYRAFVAIKSITPQAYMKNVLSKI